jgi:exodeoxyribonuclease V alpha subunit
MPPPPTATITREVLAGLVDRVTYHNAENGFCVLRLRARGHRDLVTLVGHAAVVSAGEWVNATGVWVTDRTYGQQFRAKFLKTAAPTSTDGVERYLASGMIRGIGPVRTYAEMAAHYGGQRRARERVGVVADIGLRQQVADGVVGEQPLR